MIKQELLTENLPHILQLPTITNNFKIFCKAKTEITDTSHFCRRCFWLKNTLFCVFLTAQHWIWYLWLLAHTRWQQHSSGKQWHRLLYNQLLFASGDYSRIIGNHLQEPEHEVKITYLTWVRSHTCTPKS